MADISDIMPVSKTRDNDKINLCAPSKKYEGGSCFTLGALMDIANAYNTYFSGKKQIIVKNDRKYLLKELSKELQTVCVDQLEWLNQKFVKAMPPSSVKDDIFENTFMPKGPAKQYGWLSTTDIEHVLDLYQNKYNDFKLLAVAPIDFDLLPSLNIADIHFTPLEKAGKTRIGVVFNLDEHYKSGSHWVSLFFDLNKNQIYFSDSVGTPPVPRIVALIDRIKKHMGKKAIPIEYRYNTVQHQKGGSECGVYSIIFILRLIKGETFDQINNVRVDDKTINQCRPLLFRNVTDFYEENECKKFI